MYVSTLRYIQNKLCTYQEIEYPVYMLESKLKSPIWRILEKYVTVKNGYVVVSSSEIVLATLMREFLRNI